MDRVRREPAITRLVEPSDVQIGTRVTVHWPQTACHLLEDAAGRFVQLAGAFTSFNPHLSLRCRWDGSQVVNVVATNPDWRKWRACDFTSAHWYDRAAFERYMAAHIKRDQEQGRSGRTVRDFIRELRGLRRADAQKLVLTETGSARARLDEYFAQGERAIERLLESCQRHTEPPKPKALGLVGADHLLEDCEKLGAESASFKYRKDVGVTEAGLPYVVEAAFAWRDGTAERMVIAGTNFSIALGNPFSRLGYYEDFSSHLNRQWIQRDDPVVVILHYTSPRVDFSDHGKTTLMLPRPVGRVAADLLDAVTKDWAAQKRAEARRESAAANRQLKLLKEREKPKTQKQEPPEPTGALAERITTAAAKIGASVENLLVLSEGKDPYTSWRRRRDAEVFAKLFERFVAPDAKRHLRGLFYRCVMIPNTATWPNGKSLINTYANWVKFQNAAKAARWLGLVPFEQIIDARNDEAKIYVPGELLVETGVSSGAGCDIPAKAAAVMPGFLLNGFRGRQTHRIIFYGEKTSLAEVLEPIAQQIGAEMVLVTGESSDTRLAEAVGRANADARPAVLLYFADFDPSGHQMSISVARKVQALIDFQYPNLSIKLYRVALTIDQVRDWGLPDKALKASEKRADKWREAFGVEQTEIDAALELRPDALRRAVFEAIKPFYDGMLDERVSQAEGRWYKKADAVLRDHPDYRDISARTESAYNRVKDAVADLREEQARATKILRESLPAAPELPKAAPIGKAKPALFDSSEDFVTATRRLIADKRLAGSEEVVEADEDDGGGAS